MSQDPTSSLKVTRAVLVDETGRVYDRSGVKVEFVFQDEGKTLKLFVTPLPKDEAIKANEDYMANLTESLRHVFSLGKHFAEAFRHD